MGQQGWTYRRTAMTFLGLSAAMIAPTSAFAEAPETKTIIAFEWAGCENLLPSPKDAALARAFGMIPERLRELRMQVPDLQEVPEEMLDLGMALATRPMRFAVTSAPAPGFDGLGMAFSVHLGDEALAEQLDGHVMMFGQMAGLPEPEENERFAGMHALTIPGAGPLSFGPRQARDGWRYDMIFGNVEDPDRAFGGLPGAFEDERLISRGSFDLEALDPFVSMVMPMIAPFLPPGTLDQLEDEGLIGPGAMSFEYTEGYVGDIAVSTTVARGFAKYASAWGSSTEPLTARDLAMVPADAYAAQIKKFDMSAYASQMDQLITMVSEGEANLEMVDGMFEEQFGTTVSAVMDAFGQTMIAYISDQTGGNTLMAGVMAMELDDAGPIRTLLERGGAMANQMIAQDMAEEGVPGVVQLHRREIDGVGYYQVRFPGLPIPVEPTLAITDDWLVIGLTPQACHGAVMQSRAGRSAGLADNPAFAKHLWDIPQRPSGIIFIDVERTMADGYTTMCMFCSAVTNFVRSEAGDRDPGMVMPLLSDLRKGARPMISISYFDGDDYFTQTHADSSLLVNAAGILGVGDIMPMIAGGFIGGGIAAKISEETHGWDQEWEDWDDEEWDEEGMEEGEEDDAY